jgi:hypothetical protein
MRSNGSLRILPLVLVTACSSSPAPVGGALQVQGSVVDFSSNAEVTGAASVSTSGLEPPPTITTQGASFVLDNVPANSVFSVLASVPPTHRATFSPAITVENDDLDGVQVYAVSETFLASLSAAYGVTPTAGRGVLFAKVVGAAGAARAGVDAATALAPDGGAAIDGPYYLDAQLAPDAAATATSASGWTIYFELEPGVAAMAAGPAGNVTVDMPTAPINAGAITIATVEVTDGAPMLPMNVSFSQQITPIFDRRGCVNCHSGNGAGRDLGGLTLDGGNNLIYRELVEERPNTRVNVAMPTTSKVLTMPLYESPPDAHPNVTWTSTNDPDYLLLLAWITEGAQQN